MDREFTYGLKTYRGFFRQEVGKMHIGPQGVIALVGPNNAGKTALIRSIYELRPYLVNLGNVNWAQPMSTKNEYEGAYSPQGPQFMGIPDPYSLVPEPLFDLQKEIEIQIGMEGWTYTHRWSNEHLQTQHCKMKLTRGSDLQTAVDQLKEIGQLLSRAIYIGPYRNITNQANQGSASYYDLPIGEAFVSQWRSLKTGTTTASRRAIIEAQKDIAKLMGHEAVDISATDDGKSLTLVFDNNVTQTLSDVGSGIAQMIFSIATVANRKPTLLLIDEPESHMHPSMQAKFLEALHRHVQFGTIFTTHSIGLARQAANVIHAVIKDKTTGKSSIRPFEDARNSAQLLGEMSYSQYSALGGKYLLLVEGSTEVKTLRMFLRKLDLDSEIMIIPLGGSSLIHANCKDELMEFSRIGAKVFVVFDSEKPSETEEPNASRLGFFKICAELFGAPNVLMTEKRATDNYLSEAAIQKIKSDKYRALKPYEKLEDCQPGWAKSEGWRIADLMNFSEIADTDLGKFLKKIQSEINTAAPLAG